MRNRGHRRHLLSFAVALGALGLVLAVPWTAGTTWSVVARALEALPVSVVVCLGVLWIGGLACNSVALAASLPGLTPRRALVLSLTGSAVANVLPLGGAAGIGLNYAMTRRWGFSSRGFTTYTVTTNACDVAAKLVLGAVASGLLLTSGYAPALHRMVTGALLLAVVAPLVLALLLHRPSAAALGRWVDRLVARAARRSARPVRTRLGEQLPGVAGTTTALIRRRWRPLSAGTLGYVGLLVLLLWGCLHVAGVSLALPLVVCVLAVDRLLTLVPITPGGAGVVEAGMVAALIALGEPSAPAVAGVLLYRAFTYFAEIPVGGLTALVWVLGQRRAGAAGADVSAGLARELG